MTWTRQEDATALAMARMLVDSKTIGRAVGHSADSVRLRLATLRYRREKDRSREGRKQDDR